MGIRLSLTHAEDVRDVWLSKCCHVAMSMQAALGLYCDACNCPANLCCTTLLASTCMHHKELPGEDAHR